MRKKLSAAMKYKSFSKFYIDNADEQAGCGNGLALIIILMQNKHFNPEYFRIGNQGDMTTATIEVPFNSEYVPFRKMKFEEKLKKDIMEK